MWHIPPPQESYVLLAVLPAQAALDPYGLQHTLCALPGYAVVFWGSSLGVEGIVAKHL